MCVDVSIVTGTLDLVDSDRFKAATVTQVSYTHGFESVRIYQVQCTCQCVSDASTLTEQRRRTESWLQL